MSKICQKNQKLSNQKGSIRGNTKNWIRFGSHRSVAYKKTFGLEIRLASVNKNNFHSWNKISHRLDEVRHKLEQQQGERQQRVGIFWDAVRRFCVENECICFLRAYQRLKQNNRDVLLSAHPPKIISFGGKKMNWYWARRLFVSRLPSVKKLGTLLTDGHPPREKRWSDWVLEIHEVSSERSCAILSLVWWKVEKYNVKSGGKTRKTFNIVLDPSKQTFFRPRVLQGHSGRNLIDFSLQVNVLFRMDFSSVFFTSDVQVIYIPSWVQVLFQGDQNLDAKTNGILHACGSNEQGTQTFGWNWSGCTASCLVQGQSVEEKSKHGVLGRHQTCSKERI